MKWSERAVVVATVWVAFAGPDPVRAQQPDTLRPPTAAELHARRRAWLEARRTGGAAGAPVEYGSAVVGAAPVGPVGPMGRATVRSGGVPVICRGVLYDGGGRGRGPTGGVAFEGDCRPLGPGLDDRWLGPVGPVPQESYWNGWGWSPAYPFGWSSEGGAAWQFGWPYGVAADECVLVYVAAAGAPPIELPVGLRTLGVADARDFDLAIEARLAQGVAVDLVGLDGRRLRLPAGTLLDDVRVRPCPRR